MQDLSFSEYNNLYKRDLKMNILINDSNFDSEVLNSELPVLVVFYSDWCHICKRIHEYVDELKEEYKDILKIAKANSEHTLELISSLNIKGVPTILLYKKGKLIQRINGFLSKRHLQDFLEKNLK